MTRDDFMLLADRVMAGRMDETAIAHEGKLPKGVATKVEAALRGYAVAALFQVADVLPTDTTQQAKAKHDEARANNAAVLQDILSK